VSERLGWYYAVAQGKMPAKFEVAQRVRCELPLRSASIEELWKEHERLRCAFDELLSELRQGKRVLSDLPRPSSSFLDLKIELAKRILRACELCEWRCKVDRVEGTKRGMCRLNSHARVASWFAHHGEEPPVSGMRGSGTIFFSSCNFRCVFCQNWDISQDAESGAPVDAKRLAMIMHDLIEEGVHNINFVGGEPTPNIHTILEAINLTRLRAPMLWNSNMYCSEESMRLLCDVIDIWLPDFKYGNDRCAIALSKAPNYFAIVSRNHKIAHANGDMIVRHLVLPGHIECCTRPILEWIAANCPRALVNVMAQYHPDHLVSADPRAYGELARRPTSDEMRKAYGIAESLGIVYEPVS
jgi:putative pyruvate formate lyase activating enzyme